jgi:hypothetical protein
MRFYVLDGRPEVPPRERTQLAAFRAVITKDRWRPGVRNAIRLRDSLSCLVEGGYTVRRCR